MKIYSTQILRWCGVVFAGVLLVITPLCSALEVSSASINPTVSPVIITEMLTGTKTSGTQEFIELYNTTDDPIDLTDWRLWYLSAQAADQNRPTSSGIVMLGTGADSPVIAPHDYFVLSGRSDYLASIARQFYTGTMAATGGNLRLLAPDETNPCALIVEDQVGWGNALYAQGQPVSAPPSGQSIMRALTADGQYIDTHNNSTDFGVSTVPTPGALNTHITTVSAVGSAAVQTSVAIADCVPPPPPSTGGGTLQQPGSGDVPPVVTQPNPTSSNAPTTSTASSLFPSSDVGLVTPQITELLPNPMAPQTDAADEFIELYNSNSTDFDLTGFALEVGTTTKHHFTFSPGTILAAQSFTAFFSRTTGLAMSNSGGQVRLLDPYGGSINESQAYTTAKDGQAWALANGQWNWTTSPTPGGANAVNIPSIVKKATATAATKKTAASTKKATAAKAPAAAKSKTAKAKSATQKSAVATAVNPITHPLHPTVLAIIAGFALLYGLYEYRHDLANKFYQFRTNRTARRTARAEAEGG